MILHSLNIKKFVGEKWVDKEWYLCLISLGSLCTLAKCSRSRTFLSYSARRAYILLTIEATFPNIVACISAGKYYINQAWRLSMLTSDEHDDDGEYLLLPGVAGNITKPNSGQRGAGVVHGGHIGINLGIRENISIYNSCQITWDMRDLSANLYWIASCSSQPGQFKS